MKKSALIFSLLLTLLATVLWFTGSWWYYTCKIKNTCGSQQAITASTGTPSTQPITSNTNIINKTVVDTDGDGLSDDEEKQLETDPLLKDTDSDGIPDNEEVGIDINLPHDTDNDGIIDALDLDDDNDGLSTLIESKIGTSPLHIDTDNDGIADIDEVGKDPLNPLDTDNDGNINALDPDDDDDGIETAAELIYGTNTLLVDSDGDGLTDAQEIGDLMDTPVDADKDGVIDALDTEEITDKDGDGLSDSIEAILNTDPNKKDTDGDGIDDFTEVGKNIESPLDHDLDGIIDALDSVDDSDKDNDGLTDAQEEKLASNPNKKDSDGDGINDNIEVGNNIDDPLDSDSDGILNIIDDDDDNDTLSTKYEIEIGTNPLSDDTDNDGLSDFKELENSQNNNLQDTDNDGLIDPVDTDDDNDQILTSDEIKQGTNPLIADISDSKLQDTSKEVNLKTDQSNEPTLISTENPSIDKPTNTDDITKNDSINVSKNNTNTGNNKSEAKKSNDWISSITDKIATIVKPETSLQKANTETNLIPSTNEISVDNSSNLTEASEQKETHQKYLSIEFISNDDSKTNTLKTSVLYFSPKLDSPSSEQIKKSDQVSNYLTDVVNWIKLSPNNMITLTGHTDNLGSREKNLAIGIRRVKALREYLIELGAPFQQIDFLSRGAANPLDKNATGKQSLRNNRVEISPSQL